MTLDQLLDLCKTTAEDDRVRHAAMVAKGSTESAAFLHGHRAALEMVVAFIMTIQEGDG